MENLSFLAFLALSNNRLSRQLPKGLPKLQNLQYFIMDDNPMFVPLPSQLGRLSKLQELRLANSGYSGSILGSFAWLANLTTLSLENNRLTGEILAGLSGLSRMCHLNLSRNMLAGAVPFSAGFIKRLGRNLDLSGNPGLCLNGSASSVSVSVGVEVCGGNRSASSLQQPLRSSARAPSSLFSNFPLLPGCSARSGPLLGFKSALLDHLIIYNFLAARLSHWLFVRVVCDTITKKRS